MMNRPSSDRLVVRETELVAGCTQQADTVLPAGYCFPLLISCKRPRVQASPSRYLPSTCSSWKGATVLWEMAASMKDARATRRFWELDVPPLRKSAFP